MEKSGWGRWTIQETAAVFKGNTLLGRGGGSIQSYDLWEKERHGELVWVGFSLCKKEGRSKFKHEKRNWAWGLALGGDESLENPEKKKTKVHSWRQLGKHRLKVNSSSPAWAKEGKIDSPGEIN